MRVTKERIFILTEANKHLLDTLIVDTLTLSTRARNVLRQYEMKTVRDLVDKVNSHDNWLSKLQNCGKVTTNELLKQMESVGFKYTG